MSQILILRVRSRSCQEIDERREVSVCFSQHQAEGRWILRGKPWKHLQFSTWVYWDKELWVSWGHNSLDFTEKFKNWKQAGLKDILSFLCSPTSSSSAWPKVGLEGSWHDAQPALKVDTWRWADAAWGQGWEGGETRKHPFPYAQGHKARATLRDPAEWEQTALQLFCPNQEVEITSALTKKWR